jgi:hypothetical protein
MKRLFTKVAVGLAVSFMSSAFVCHQARADEQMDPLAEDGDWIALAHRTSETANVDLCMAADRSATLMLRSDGTTTELRSSNDTWSLPSGVQGTLKVNVSNDDYTFDISGNTDTVVTSIVDSTKLTNLLDDMEKADILQLTIGNNAPIIVSLSGSTKVINAFRTCAGIGGGAAGAGSNPFQQNPGT